MTVAIPEWLHRLHADGLFATDTVADADEPIESQRFIDRWDRVADGY